MPKSEALKRANKKWEAKAYWRPTIRLPKDLESIVQTHIDSTGTSLNGFIRQAIEEKLERES